MMIRYLFPVFVLLGSLFFAAAYAQEVEAEPEGVVEAPEEGEGEAEVPAFDAEPFLNSMVALRGAALTCDPFVGGSPEQRTQGIVGYFDALGQSLPDLADAETQASLRQFIGSQAATLCQGMLDSAFASFQQRAAEYEANRPEEWPAAPAANPGQWCEADYCLDR